MPKGKQPDGGKQAAKWTTFRLHASDGEDLSELADRMNMSIADAYRDLGFAEVVRKKLSEFVKKRLEELQNRKPQ